ncbi:MAG: alpha-glucan family phosphorylase [Hyphomicrobiales bacterium]
MVGLVLPLLPDVLSPLRDLALDLRWTWSHEGDALWEQVDARLWEQTRSPWTLLQHVPADRLKLLAGDAHFLAELESVVENRKAYLEGPSWFQSTHEGAGLGKIAYFSMEFGLGEALPLYAGGLGVLAGDFLKAASDLGIPMIGVGLLYQEGYFRQVVDAEGRQHEAYPFNEPAVMPIEPVMVDGTWLRVSLSLPGRILRLRVWQATVGRMKLYLLDSNDLLNSPTDRGITGKLYGGDAEMRLMQEAVLGIGGWGALEALGHEIEICHINEGHAALAVIERARRLAKRTGLDFWQALWATRAGNIFTTHTPMDSGFDRFHPDLLRKYLPVVGEALTATGISPNELLGLGRADPDDETEPFNMAYLAMRGSGTCLAVSKLHERVSRRIFQPLFRRWPEGDVPVGHVTNGVHAPTWDSAEADQLWTEACGKQRWRVLTEGLPERIQGVADEELWALRGEGRRSLVRRVRGRLAFQLRQRALGPEVVKAAENALDPNILTLGFARRFTDYKRPNLLLRDPERFARLLLDEHRPVQIIVAGKAHPADELGKDMIREWIAFAQQPRHRGHVVFLEDYDIALAQELVQGVDVWINTPRRPWEACGTSGMKVLVNGGLNCSVRDGWWDEAYEPGLGWCIGDGGAGEGKEIDAADAEDTYDVIEHEIVPEFYDRDEIGLPRAWIARIRRSMSTLTSAFSSARMAREYVERAYLPAAAALRHRLANGYAVAKELANWSARLRRDWPSLHIGDPIVGRVEAGWRFAVPVVLGEVAPEDVRVELYADRAEGKVPDIIPLSRVRAISRAVNGYIYAGQAPASRPAGDFTVRVIPCRREALVPAELALIAWQR